MADADLSRKTVEYVEKTFYFRCEHHDTQCTLKGRTLESEYLKKEGHHVYSTVHGAIHHCIWMLTWFLRDCLVTCLQTYCTKNSTKQ